MTHSPVPDDARVNAGLRLLKKTWDRLDAVAARLGVSRAAVVEALTWQFADQTRPPAEAPDSYPPDHRGLWGRGRRKKAKETS